MSGGIVYLVGAGPGDPELVTLRGWRLLRRCDVLVYDSLVAPELVAASRAPEKVHVGKTEGGHSLDQGEINALLVALARRPGVRRVVRLKGGDPFVLGRGGEELLACRAAGISCEVVPGVTAGIAAPALVGVPVTHRGLAGGVTLLSGHSADGVDWAALVASRMTLVFYMAVGRLAEIAAALVAHGQHPDTPALIVQDGTLPGARTVRAPLAGLAECARAAGVRSPAVLVVGEVARLHDEAARVPAALAGRTAVIACAEDSEFPEADAMRALGARVYEVEVVRCLPRSGDPAVTVMLDALAPGEVVVFSSAWGAEFLLDLLRLHRPGFDPAALRCFATTLRKAERVRSGRAARTDRAATSAFGPVRAPARAGGEQVAALLRECGVAPPQRVWLPRSSAARDALPSSLAAAGYAVRDVALYDALPTALPADLARRIARGEVDALLLTAASCARALLAAVPELASARPPVPLIAGIGPRLAAEVAREGLRVTLVPDRPEVSALVAAVVERMLATPRVRE